MTSHDPLQTETIGKGATGADTPRDEAVVTTLLLSDLVGSTELVEELGDRETAALFQRHDRLARDLLEEHGGREIDKTDGFLLLFDRPWKAVSYALAYHKGLRELSVTARVGIHLGEVILHRNAPRDVERGAKPVEVEGLAKPTTARLMSLGVGGQTLLTRTAYEVARRSSASEGGLNLEWRRHGRYRFKGIGADLEVFEVGVPGTAPLVAPSESQKARRVDDGATLASAAPSTTRRRLRPVAILALTAALAVVLGGLVWFHSRPPAPAAPLLIAVPEPKVDDAAADESTGLFVFAVRTAASQALLELDGVATRSRSEIDAVDGPPAALALAVAADEVLVSSLVCAANDCLVELDRINGSDGASLDSVQVRTPRHLLLLAAQAVRLGVRGLYPQRTARSEATGPEVGPEAYAAYLELRRRFLERPDGPALTSMLAEAAELRAGSPRFVEAAVLEADMAISSFRLGGDAKLLERARRVLAEARDLAPEDPSLLFKEVHLETVAGDLEAADEKLAVVEQLVPLDVQLLDRQALLLQRRGEIDRALALQAEAIDRQPSWQRLYSHARLAREHGEIATARASLARLLKRFPGNRWGLSLRAVLELETGDLDRAAALYAELTADVPAPVDLVNFGIIHLLRRDYDSAAESFERALTYRPQSPLCMLNLADAHLLAGRAAKASALYRRTLTAIDGLAEPTWQDEMLRAQAFAHLEARREAVAAVQSALQKAPEHHSEVAFEAAVVYSLVGERTAALVNAEAALRLGREARWFDLPWFDSIRSEPELVTALRRASGEASGS